MGAWSPWSSSRSPAGWSRRCTPSSTPTSSVTLGRCPIWPGGRGRNSRAVPSGETVTDPPEAEAGQGDGGSDEDRRLVPLEGPVAAGRLVDQYLAYPELVDAALDESVAVRERAGSAVHTGDVDVGTGAHSYDVDALRPDVDALRAIGEEGSSLPDHVSAGVHGPIGEDPVAGIEHA